MVEITRAVAPAYGDFGAVHIEKMTVNEVPPASVLIAVRAAGVNPVDYKLAGGLLGQDPSKLPMPIGCEMAGVVEEIGSDIAGNADTAWLQPGREVTAFPVDGAFADRVIVPAADVFPKPKNLTFEQAANLLLAGSTATHLIEATGTTEGSVVVVHGASGSVGVFAVQLAKLRGARVIGTASEANHGLLRSLGTEPVTYGPGLLDRLRELVPDGITASIDCAGTEESRAVSLALIDDPRHFATVVDTAFQAVIDIGGRALGGMLPESERGDDIRNSSRRVLSRLAEEGKLQIVMSGTYALDKAGDALALSAEGHPGGNLAVVP